MEAEDEVGGDVLTGLVEEEYEYYEYDIVTGFIKVPQNYSGLQVDFKQHLQITWKFTSICYFEVFSSFLLSLTFARLTPDSPPPIYMYITKSSGFDGAVVSVFDS